MKNCIILSRVSTLKQDLTQQTDEVIKQAVADGYTQSDITIIEDKESAVKLTEEQRLGLNELKNTILSNPGKYDCVYAYEISRIGRRAEVNYSIRNFLQQNRVQLIILKPYIKLFDSNFNIVESANMTFAIFNALAENEGYIRKERLARGRARAQAAGKYVGGHLPLGYTIGENRMIVIDEEDAKTVRTMFEDYASGRKSSLVLGREMYMSGKIQSVNIESASVIVRMMLKDVAYIGGQPCYSKFENGHKVKGPKKQSGNIYPRIISDELFNKVQEVRKNAICNQKTTSKHIYYCKGIIRDASSGYVMSAQNTVASYTRAYTTTEGRYSLVIPINIADSLAWHLAKRYCANNASAESAKTKNEVKKKYASAQAQIEHINTMLGTLDEKEMMIQTRIINGKLSEKMGDAMVADINRQRKDLISERTRLTEESERYYSYILRYAGRTVEAPDYESIVDDAERYRIVHECITSIDLTKFPKDTLKKGQPVGQLVFTYSNGMKETYLYHNYTRKVWTEDMSVVEYEYMDRFIAQFKKKYHASKK